MSAVDLRIARTGLSVPSDAVEALNAGELILLASSQANRGRGRSVLCGVAALMTDLTVVQMVIHGGGLVSISVDPQTAFQLGLRRMPGRRSRPQEGEYLVSIEASSCRGTGISAKDRATTLRAAGALDASQDDLVMPGHVMPLLVRGHVARGSGLPEFAHGIVARNTEYVVPAWCDVLGPEGELAELDQSLALAQHLGLRAVVSEECLTANPYIDSKTADAPIARGDWVRV